MNDTDLLKQILTAQVLILGKQIKDELARNGAITTSDCTSDAIRLIKQKMPQILKALS